ncbi:uncharacterized protein EI90DRAFT_2976090, partial [Cantharellus anzutake]|uniref:uncharacterized protein n=1 Tax=Cantharellus anzutake TaxID=1750568 RepID=UPI0019057D73
TPLPCCSHQIDATITVRVIKSFTYRTEKSLVLHHVNLEEITVGQLKERVKQTIKTQPAWKAYKTVELDTLKLYTKAHGAKTANLIINLDHDDWILDDNTVVLASHGLENESEVSFFNRKDYEAFKLNPETKWG